MTFHRGVTTSPFVRQSMLIEVDRFNDLSPLKGEVDAGKAGEVTQSFAGPFFDANDIAKLAGFAIPFSFGNGTPLVALTDHFR